MPRQATELTPFGRRVLAAALLAGLDQAELASRLQVSQKTLARTLSGKRDLKEREMEALPGLLGVPDWFLREGLREHDGDASAELRDELARLRDDLAGRLDDQAEMLRILMTRVDQLARSE